MLVLACFKSINVNVHTNWQSMHRLSHCFVENVHAADGS